jgi:hypothetical protein
VAGSPEHMQIEYGVYVPSDAEATAKLLGEVFSRYDPPAVAAELTASEFEAFVRLLCPKAAVEGLTIVGRLAGTGELIGVLLTEDSASALPDGMDRLSAKFDPIFDILGQLDTDYRGGQTVRPGESLHLFLLGVSDRVAGRGVAQQLVTACLEHGTRRESSPGRQLNLRIATYIPFSEFSTVPGTTLHVLARTKPPRMHFGKPRSK